MKLEKPYLYEIKRGKLLTLINLLIGIGLVYFFMRQINKDAENGSYVWITFDALAIFFVVSGFFKQLKILIKDIPRLAISEKGIYLENYGTIPIDLINEVAFFEKKDKNPYIAVYIDNPEAYLTQQNGFKKALFSAVYKQHGTPIVTRLRGTYDLTELKEVTKRHINRPYK